PRRRLRPYGFVLLTTRQLGDVVRVLRWLSGELARERHGLAHIPAQVATILADPRPAAGCRLCGATLPPRSSGAGRPRVRCEQCSPSRCKSSANSKLVG